jgi:non-specific protein-tyrosine kinase
VELRDYLKVLRRRKWTIVLVTLIAVGVASVSSSLQTPVYEATAQLLLQPRSTESLFDPNGAQRSEPARALQTEMEVLKSRPVKAAVERRLGNAPDVSVVSVGQTDVIEVRARHTDPEAAAAVANTYAVAYIDFRRNQAIDDILAAGKELQAKIDNLQAQITPLNDQINRADPKTRPYLESRLRPQMDSLRSQQVLFKQKLDQLQVDAALKTGGAQLVTPAISSNRAVEPRPTRTAALALVVGLIVGVALALLFDYLDDSVKNREDLERVLPHVPILGLIPGIPGRKDRDAPKLISSTSPNSPATEAYRSLRTSVQFLGLDSPIELLVVTSPSAVEGKTTTLANLAVALARAGQRTIAVCCDLRRPRLHEFFGLDNSVGFTSVLLGEAPLSEALQSVPGEANLRLLASGPMPPDPSELLSSSRAAELLGSLRRQADIVLIDTPPVLPVTDATILASRADATLVVVRANSTTRKQVTRTIEILGHVDTATVGLVLNNASAEGEYGYSYGYYNADHQDRFRAQPRHAAGGREGNGNGRAPKRQPEARRSR